MTTEVAAMEAEKISYFIIGQIRRFQINLGKSTSIDEMSRYDSEPVSTQEEFPSKHL